MRTIASNHGRQTKTIELKSEKDLSWVELANSAGLRVRLQSNGSLYAIEHGSVMINQVLPGPLEEGLNRIYLRVHTQKGIQSVPVAGPMSPGQFSTGKQQACWRGISDHIAFECALKIHPDQPVWFWHLRARNERDQTVRIDFVYGQDLGLAGRSALRINEAYASQYIDHEVIEHPENGFLIMSRQNQDQQQQVPWIMQGCLPRAAGYSTDGFQFFGLESKATNLPAAAGADKLPSRRRQYEMAFAGLQSEQFTVQPGASAETVFFAWFEPNHPLASGAVDAQKVDLVKRAFVELPAETPGTSLERKTSLFQRAALFSSESLTDEEVTRFFGSERRHVERARGDLLSFFYGRERHVVMKAKELEAERPHGHILRSGRALFPELSTLCSTCFMPGVFNSQVTLGNTSFNKLLSVFRNPLNLIKAGGQRIFVETSRGWELLAIPSAFEMGAGCCRWIYKNSGQFIEIRTASSPDDPAVGLDVRVTGGKALSFLISHELVLGNNEFDSRGTVTIDSSRCRITCVPDPGELVRRKYPEVSYFIVSPDSESVAAMGGDGLLFEDGEDRGYPYAVIKTKPVRSFRLALGGSLEHREEALRLADRYGSGDWSIEKMITGGERFWASLNSSMRLAGGDDARVSKLDDILRWYAHNAMIHYTAPHGLEQYSGAAWGVRDVCQGPVEFLLTTRNAEPVREVLKLIFSHQYLETGAWPQWFMFDAYHEVQTPHSHGDVIVWPLKAVCDYVEATNDFSVLQMKAPYTRLQNFAYTETEHSIFDHLLKLLDRVETEFVPGTALIRYGEGDWDDTLQPADPEMKTRMVSGWTVELLYQTLHRFAEICRRSHRSPLAARLDRLVQSMREDFNKHLIVDGVVSGFLLFESDGKSSRCLLHPRDETTGIHHRLLPMTRGIISEIFTPRQAEHHERLIREHLQFPDGVRLMDKPATYRGGIEKYFKRAETAANFGREIGLQYVHAHIRYLEALAKLGRADELWQGIETINPILIQEAVPNACTRQSNAYFSSSDGDFDDRYEASARFHELRLGTVAVKGGWRIYSSGPGIFVRLILNCLLGRREHFEDTVFDPVLPLGLNGLAYDSEYAGRTVSCRYHVEKRCFSPWKIVINGEEIADLRRERNPYRPGGALINRAEFIARLNQTINTVDVYL